MMRHTSRGGLIPDVCSVFSDVTVVQSHLFVWEGLVLSNNSVSHNSLFDLWACGWDLYAYTCGLAWVIRSLEEQCDFLNQGDNGVVYLGGEIKEWLRELQAAFPDKIIHAGSALMGQSKTLRLTTSNVRLKGTCMHKGTLLIRSSCTYRLAQLNQLTEVTN